MELFKFNVISEQTVLEQGEMINRIKSVLWVERYRDPGEFQIVAQLSSGLKNFLPAGTFISHADTLEVMIVENHEISENPSEDPLITISGRSFETYLENRIVGTNQVRASPAFVEYELAAAYTQNQTLTLINDHVIGSTDDDLANITAYETVTSTGISEARIIARGDVHKAVVDLLAVDDLGIKTVRRNTFGVSGSDLETRLVVHEGVDRSTTVIFSWESGDLDGLNYLFSAKRRKNSAMVQGRYVNVIVDLGPTKYDRRMMLVDGSDIDDHLETAPTGTQLTTIINRMTTRGRQTLRRQNNITIGNANVSDVSKYRYRRDYNVGDWVMVDGNFGQIAKMRITEYAEIEDENGESGSPTLSLPEE